MFSNPPLYCPVVVSVLPDTTTVFTAVFEAVRAARFGFVLFASFQPFDRMLNASDMTPTGCLDTVLKSPLTFIGFSDTTVIPPVYTWEPFFSRSADWLVAEPLYE